MGMFFQVSSDECDCVTCSVTSLSQPVQLHEKISTAGDRDINIHLRLCAEAILCDFAVDRHSRPVQLLGCLAFVPLGAEQHRQQKVAFAGRSADGCLKLAKEFDG